MKDETIIHCSNELVESLQTAYERTFYHFIENANFGIINSLAEGNHINYALCSHRAERWIIEAPVDGYDPTTKTVSQYHGCHRHGCHWCFHMIEIKLSTTT